MLANRLLIKSVTARLGDRLTHILSPVNAAEIFIVADRLTLQALKNKALHVLIKNYHVIFASSSITSSSSSGSSSTSRTATSDTTHDMSRIFSPSEQRSLEILHKFYTRASDRGVTIDHSLTRISEILAICFEAVDQSQERYVEAKRQNDEELAECVRAVSAQQEAVREAVDSTMKSVFALGSYFYPQPAATSLARLTERLSRLRKTRDALRRQESHIHMQRRFLREQQSAYHNLSVLGGEERHSVQGGNYSHMPLETRDKTSKVSYECDIGDVLMADVGSGDLECNAEEDEVNPDEMECSEEQGGVGSETKRKVEKYDVFAEY
jgi:chaperonin cofactor prefoldin